ASGSTLRIRQQASGSENQRSASGSSRDSASSDGLIERTSRKPSAAISVSRYASVSSNSQPVSRKITGIAGSTSAMTFSTAADSVPKDDTSANLSRPTIRKAVAITSAGDASRSARSSSSAGGRSAATGCIEA